MFNKNIGEESWDDMRHLNVFLIGTGLIGAAFLKQVEDQQEILREKYNIDLRIAGVANSKLMFVEGDGVELNNWQGLLEYMGDALSLEQFLEEAEAIQLEDNNAFTDGVLVDCTASQEVADIYFDAMESELHVVTPNKKAASGDFDYYRDLQEAVRDNGVRFLYETNVGAGLPVVSTLRDLVMTGDLLLKVEGILSGTLSYIFNNFGEGKKFSDVVMEAQKKGYTEPDPRDDLNGLDVARKILILARETGAELDLVDVKVESLVSEQALKAATVEAFFLELEKEDEKFTKLFVDAAKEGKVLRYIARFENGKAVVKLEAVGPEHPFYLMSGSENVVSFTTERYSETPLVVRGPGAGAEVTAAGVFADVLRVAN